MARRFETHVTRNEAVVAAIQWARGRGWQPPEAAREVRMAEILGGRWVIQLNQDFWVEVDVDTGVASTSSWGEALDA